MLSCFGSQFRRWISAVTLLACGLLFASNLAWAQSSACNANEDVVTFNFAAASSSDASGSSVTWTAGTTANTYTVATVGSVPRNTIAFSLSLSGPVWVAGFPAQGIQGNNPDTLDLNMDPSAAGQFITLRMNFNRPMDKVRFNMFDVDRQNGSWHDVVRVSGLLNGNTTTIPSFSPTTPASYATLTTANGAAEINTTLDGNCANTNTACNVQVNFTNAVDAIDVVFLAGASVAAPSSQRVGFDSFSYCVPKRELSLTKVDATDTFVAGQTATYFLTVTNGGGAATAGNYTVVDQLPQGLSFLNPQTPGGGWACALSTVTFATDTATCVQAGALAANSSTVLTLTVSVSPVITATSVDNRAKVFGGSDPNKPTLTATGALLACTQASEGWQGGGATYFNGTAVNAGCAFENTLLARRTQLTATKSNGVTTLTAGSTTTYTLTFANLGPSSGAGAVVLDPAVPGLNCTSVAFSSTPAGSVTISPITPTITALQSTGITMTPTFPANSTATFVVTCGVTATGQ
jgi:uncharacterized repeat protein (TIGR01451 family)